MGKKLPSTLLGFEAGLRIKLTSDRLTGEKKIFNTCILTRGSQKYKIQGGVQMIETCILSQDTERNRRLVVLGREKQVPKGEDICGKSRLPCYADKKSLR